MYLDLRASIPKYRASGKPQAEVTYQPRPPRLPEQRAYASYRRRRVQLKLPISSDNFSFSCLSPRGFTLAGYELKILLRICSSHILCVCHHTMTGHLPCPSVNLEHGHCCYAVIIAQPWDRIMTLVCRKPLPGLQKYSVYVTVLRTVGQDPSQNLIQTVS